jgi:hypothetical protein
MVLYACNSGAAATEGGHGGTQHSRYESDFPPDSGLFTTYYLLNVALNSARADFLPTNYRPAMDS